MRRAARLHLRRRGTAIVDTPEGILVVRGRGNTYLLPGGGAHRHESREKAAIRELEEETGLKALDSTFLFEYRGRINAHKVFLVRTSGTPEPRREIRQIAYSNGSNVKVSSTTRGIIERYLGGDA